MSKMLNGEVHSQINCVQDQFDMSIDQIDLSLNNSIHLPQTERKNKHNRKKQRNKL